MNLPFVGDFKGIAGINSSIILGRGWSESVDIDGYSYFDKYYTSSNLGVSYSDITANIPPAFLNTGSTVAKVYDTKIYLFNYTLTNSISYAVSSDNGLTFQTGSFTIPNATFVYSTEIKVLGNKIIVQAQVGGVDRWYMTTNNGLTFTDLNLGNKGLGSYLQVYLTTGKLIVVGYNSQSLPSLHVSENDGVSFSPRSNPSGTTPVFLRYIVF